MKFKHLISLFQNTNARAFSSLPEIDIPKRIPRGPTDILKAIASTYQRDPTGPHYKYHDDPYLIPYSNATKRSYALSKESGRKSAYWIRQQHPELFQHKVAEPFIEAYAPKPEYTEDSDVSLEALQDVIRNAWVTDAVTVYSALRKKGIEVDSQTKLSLLEFLCFFNAEDPISEDWIEERWFRLGSKNANKNIWKYHPLIEQLFEELKETTPAAYSALICGMCTYGEVSRAMKMYEEARDANIPLNVEVYNSLLSKAYMVRESHEKMWELVKELMVDMSQRKITPNIRTLNGALETLSKMTTAKFTQTLSLQLLSEFKALNIEPSLTSYFFLMEVYYRNASKLKGIMHEVLSDIENKALTIQDPRDILFFARAMEICSNLKDIELAYRLHNVLLKDNNYNLIGDAMKESVYYRNYFFLLCNMATLSKLMETYEQLVPSIYIPEPAVTNAILRAVYDNMAWEQVPRLWSEVLLFEQGEVSGILENILTCAAASTDPSLAEKMSKIAWDVWEKVEDNPRERKTLQWTGSMLGNVILILVKGDETAKAHLAMDKLIRLGSTLMNEPPIPAMEAYINCCIADNQPDLAIKTIQYCDEMGFTETSDFARKLDSSLQLSEKQREKLLSIVGAECLKTPKNEKSESQK